MLDDRQKLFCDLAEICLFFVWVCNLNGCAVYQSTCPSCRLYCPVSDGHRKQVCQKTLSSKIIPPSMLLFSPEFFAHYLSSSETHTAQRQTDKVKLLLLSPPLTTNIAIFNFGEVLQCNTTLWPVKRGIKSQSAWLFQIKQFLNSATNSLYVPSPI